MTVAEGRADIKSSKFIFSILTSGYRGYSGRKNRVPLTVTYDPKATFPKDSPKMSKALSYGKHQLF